MGLFFALCRAMLVPEQPRERFITYGGDRVSTPELLALILGTGTRGRSATTVAQSILHWVGGIGRLARAMPQELVSIPGIGAARAARIGAAFHLGRRAMEAQLYRADIIRDPTDLHERLRFHLGGLTQEVFWVVALDSRHAIIKEIEVVRGSLTGVEVHPREVFRPLIRLSAAAAIVAHNHPSGDPTPSEDDLELTYRIHNAGILLGIPVLDHIIVGGRRCLSVFEDLNLHNNVRSRSCSV